MDEIRVVSRPDPGAAIYPSIDLYERVACPRTIVLPARGFYARRRASVQALIDRRSGRRLIEIDSNHNVPMVRPDDLARIVLEVVHRIAP